MHKVRIGVIGMGNIGRFHADYLLDRKVDRCELRAVCSTSPQKLVSYRAKGVEVFGSGEDLIQSGKVDAVLIATPHFQHTDLGIAAIKAGVHALIEKPISAHKADAERLIVVHRRKRRVVFAGMFQMRTEPRYWRIRELIQAGELGEVVRVNWINTDWYRTEVYYASSDWRATWRGEGGGVLLNQCLHNLDALQWVCGMPVRVRGFCQFGRFHDIEVEDNVTAYLEWSNRATGVFVSSTGEAPGTNRLEIAGSKGRLVLEHDKLTFTRNETDMLEFNRTAKQGFVKPTSRVEEIPIESAVAPHAAVTQNFVNAILHCEPLIAPGEEGIHSVELANAIVFSSLAGRTLELPMQSLAWEKKLKQLASRSKAKKKVAPASSDDFAASFKR